jgi:hypothetical protein
VLVVEEPAYRALRIEDSSGGFEYVRRQSGRIVLNRRPLLA